MIRPDSCLIKRLSAAHCKRLPLIPKNGIVLAPRMGHGAKAKYGCRDGYALKGNRYAECQFGNWSGDTPKCEEGNCEVMVGDRNTPVRRDCASLLNVRKPSFTVPRWETKTNSIVVQSGSTELRVCAQRQLSLAIVMWSSAKTLTINLT